MADLKEKAVALLNSVAGFDSQAVAGTELALFTVPTGKICVPMFVVIRTVSASMATCVVTFGVGGGNCDEFRGDVTLTNLDGTTKYAIIAMQDLVRNTPDGGVLLTAGETFSVEITTADADGGTATIDVFGFLYDA